jgi:hypothetical protein
VSEVQKVSLRSGQFELERRGDVADIVRHQGARFDEWNDIPWSDIENLGVLICEVRELVEERQT